MWTAPPERKGTLVTENIPNAAPVAAPTEPTLDQPYYGIGLGGAIARFFKKYATFSGRASRAEFWWAFLFNAIVSFALSVIGGLITPSGSLDGILTGIYSLVILIPNLAISWRRLHDTNKGGLWFFVPAILSGIGTLLLTPTLMNYSAALKDGTASELTGGSTALVLLAAVFMIVGGVLGIVLYVKGPKAEGARFDK